MSKSKNVGNDLAFALDVLRRVMVCVHACEGVNEEWLKPNIVMGMVDVCQMLHSTARRATSEEQLGELVTEKVLPLVNGVIDRMLKRE